MVFILIFAANKQDNEILVITVFFSIQCLLLVSARHLSVSLDQTQCIHKV